MVSANLRTMLVLIKTVSLTAAEDDFGFFNVMNKKEDGYYEGLLKLCFEEFGRLSVTPRLLREAVFDKALNTIQTTMTNEIASLFALLNLFKGKEEIYAELIVKSYHVVPYHNICHGLAVAMFSSSIGLANANIDNFSDGKVKRRPRPPLSRDFCTTSVIPATGTSFSVI